MTDDAAARRTRRAVEQRVSALQRRQAGAFTRAQAISGGLTEGAVDGRVRHGRYRVLLPGVMAERGVPDSWELRAMAGLLWAGGEAVLARGSAATALGLPVPAAATRALHLLVRDRTFATVYLRMARRHGIEPTAMNRPVRDGDGGRRYLDAVHLPEHVWVELDSRRFHGTLLDQNDDAVRTASIERAGVWADPLRFTWDDVTRRAGEVAAQVRAALAAASRGVE